MSIEYNRSDQTVGCADCNANIHHMISVSEQKVSIINIIIYLSVKSLVIIIWTALLPSCGEDHN